jgi:hypothetical protein
MSWLITGTQKTLDGIPFRQIPTGQHIPGMLALGEGGYFAGYISHAADGIPTHALIVAPANVGASGLGYTISTNLLWKTTSTLTTGTDSVFDGVANTAAMVAAGITNHPAAAFCVGLSIDGLRDWYLPARWELDIAYFNLKPTTEFNSTEWGDNPYSVPKRNAKYTTAIPAQTSVQLFIEGSSQAFRSDGAQLSQHWSSTQANDLRAWKFEFSSGLQNGSGSNRKGVDAGRVRAFRRIAL